jgi:PAS domain S-box-containing protein
VPIPLLLSAVLLLWVADLRTSHESAGLHLILNVAFLCVASLLIGGVTARKFLATGQPGLLVLGCGATLLGLATLAASLLADEAGNMTVTVHNLGVAGSALCHLVGLQLRARVARPLRWAAVAYAVVLLSVALIVAAAMNGWTPVFFVQGQGGTPVRQAVLCAAIAMYAAAALLMLRVSGRRQSAFFAWYGYGLALLATGLTGVLLQTVHGGALGWAGRVAQYFGGVYLLIAAAAARQTGTGGVPLAAVDDATQVSQALAILRHASSLGVLMRYGLAVLATAAALGLRQGIESWVGAGFPPYLTYFPIIMVAALLAGFGPGLLATGLAGLAANWWYLPPVDHLAIDSPVDRLGLVIFLGIGLFMSLAADVYRRARDKAAAYDQAAVERKAGARLAVLAAASFEGIIEIEAGRIVDCNEQAARMLGYQRSEVLGLEYLGLVVPEDRDRVAADIQGGRDAIIEHGMLGKQGARLEVEVHGRSVAPGSTTRHKAVRDVTARRRAQEALRASERRFRDVASVSADWIWEIDREGRYTFASGRIQDVLGYRPDEILGRTPFDFMAPADAERTRSAFEAIAQRREIFRDLENTNLHKDGSLRHILTSGVPILDDGGALVGYRGIDRDVTARVQAEASLRASEERLRLHAENSPLAVIEWDRDFVVSRWSGAAERMFGWSAAQTVGRPIMGLNIIHEEDLPLVQQTIGRLTDGSSPAVVSANRNYTRDGRVLHCEWYNSVLNDAQGTMVSVLSQVLDVTARTLAEEQIRASEQQLRLFIENAPAAIAMLDANMRYLSASRRWYRDYGLAGDLVGRSHYEVFPDLPDAWKEAHRRCQAGAVEQSEADPWVRADGQTEWLRWEIRPWYATAGRIGGIVIFTENITEDKKIESALRESGERLHLALAAGRMAAWDWHVPSGEVVWNETHFRMLGYEPEEVRPTYRAFADRVHPDDRAAVEALIRRCMDERQVYTSVFRTLWPDGTLRWLEARGDFVYDASGRPLRCFGVMLDITDARRAQEALRETIVELEHSNRELEQFAYVSSHDLQEPLRQVRAFAQLLRERYGERLDDKARQYLQFVHDGAARMSELVQGLLDYSRIGGREAEREPVCCAAALDAALANLEVGIAEAQARITRDELPVLTAHPVELAQLFQNLVGNALKFRRSGVPAEIHVGCRRDGGTWRFSVSDNGIGIAPEHRERIFQIFQTLHGRDRYAGTGIGLAICKKIVERHGGRIWVEATPGGGATFFFTLQQELAG